MDAMTAGSEIRISYQKYTSEKASEYTLRPYAVKEVAKRWYIIAYCIEREALRVYGLDRILSLETTDRSFRMPDRFDIDELFATSFGIYLPEGPGKTITFRTSLTEARYLRDLPLHESQKEVKTEGNSVTFSIFVHPNKALIMEICKHGSALEVLAPAEIRDAVAAELRKAADIYSKP
jgi:predicted DNA-binding transcriptional regulator YafY